MNMGIDEARKHDASPALDNPINVGIDVRRNLGDALTDYQQISVVEISDTRIHG
jgi:hypothetical protein